MNEEGQTVPEFAPDLVLTNGKVVTVDDAFSIAGAVAIYDGKVVAVGGSEEIGALAGTRTRRVDLGGRCVVPGQMDNHVHFLLAGLDALDGRAKVNIATLKSIDAILTEIKAKVDVTPVGEWIGTSCMYRGALVDGRFPNRHDLDKVAPDHPVYIFQSGKNIIANSYAIRLAGITRDTPDPAEPEGWIVRDDDGEPTGHLIAGAADMARKAWWARLGKPIKKWDFLHFAPHVQREALLAQQAIYHACGVVAARDMGTSVDELDTFIAVHRAGQLKIRTDIVLGLPTRYLSQDEISTAVSSYFGPRQHIGDDMLRVNGVKLVVVNDGWWAYSPDKLRFLIDIYTRHDWNMAIHINTGSADESTELVLSLLEEAAKTRPVAGRRISFEHGLGLQNPDHHRRARDLGVVIAANPMLVHHAAARSMRMNAVMEQVRIAKAPERDPWKRTVRDWGSPLRDWHDVGLVVSGGTDNPAVAYDPSRPFLGHYAALTGDTLAGVLLPGQEITREQLLRMYTVNGAYSCWQEDRRGSIEPGKLADLVVLDRDILTCPDREVAELQVLQTYVGGELVHER